VDKSLAQLTVSHLRRRTRTQVTTRAVVMSRVLLGNRLRAVQGRACLGRYRNFFSWCSFRKCSCLLDLRAMDVTWVTIWRLKPPGSPAEIACLGACSHECSGRTDRHAM